MLVPAGASKSSRSTARAPPLVAPEGQVFVAGLQRDFDGDGALDALTLARPADGPEPGALLYYRAGGGRP